MRPDARLAAFLARARRRLTALDVARFMSNGAMIGAGYFALRMRAGATIAEAIAVSVALLTAAAAAGVVASRRRSAAAAVEARTPAFRNALVTSDALLRGTLDAKPYVRELVLGDTAARASTVDLRALFPARVHAIALAMSLLLLGTAGALAVAPSQGLGILAPRSAGTPGAVTVDVTIVPPGYTRLPQRRLRNPERIEAIEGSRIAVAAGAHALEVIASTQTFLQAGPILIPLTIAPDRAPDVRIAEPARDLYLPNAARDIAVRVEARDDFGVTALSLAYTKVSGSGESFEFVEGTLPLSDGRALIRPSALGLSAGDTLVYRAVARDAHPTRGPVQSDAFVIEIVSASEAMAEGFSIDDQRDKYALSQQMVILKTERLMAARRTMPAAAVAEEAAMIGAEQRQVRAEFVFMMGGEVEDEEVEAEQSSEISEGREQNEGRRDLLSAIRSMSDAAALLQRPDLDQALAAEKRALASLQRALTRSRYILRVLSTRERIDDSRRLSGDRAGAPGWRREPAAAPESADAATLRQALAVVALLARKQTYGDEDRWRMSTLARQLLATGRADLRDAAEPLATAARTRNTDVIATLIDRAAIAIDNALEADARAISVPAGDVPDRVRRALAERARAGGRR